LKKGTQAPSRKRKGRHIRGKVLTKKRPPSEKKNWGSTEKETAFIGCRRWGLRI